MKVLALLSGIGCLLSPATSFKWRHHPWNGNKLLKSTLTVAFTQSMVPEHKFHSQSDVRAAFDRAKLSKLPRQQLESNASEDKVFEKFSEYIEEKRAEVKAEGAVEMLKINEPDDKIIQLTKITADELAVLKQSLKD